ncbi:MAG: hypothetical protein HY659_00280 [Rhizobiales bacterium]|nr:hypothetical protein [Hyphomicrobiales bacterium]
MLDDRKLFMRVCAAVGLSALIAGAVTFGSSIGDDANALTFERPTSELKGDRLDMLRAPARQERARRCFGQEWVYSPDACPGGKPRDIRTVSIVLPGAH